MANLVKDITAAADDIARTLRSSNYRANFSPESLWDIDLFFDDHGEGGVPKAKGLLAEQLGRRLFALGGYVGETIRRKLGGEWQADDADPQGEINIALKLPDGTMIRPVQRVMKRLNNGAEDGIAAYGAALGLSVGSKPAPFSPWRAQGSGATPVVPASLTALSSEYSAQQERRTTRSKNIFGGVLLFLGSALVYSLLTSMVAKFQEPRGYVPPTSFLALAMILIWAGGRTCSEWPRVLGYIWFCFCPLAVFNSWYFLHLQENPLMRGNEWRLSHLAVMSRSSVIMAGVVLVFAGMMVLVERIRANRTVEGRFELRDV